MENTAVELIHVKYIVAALLYSSIGLVMLIASFVLIDLLTPKLCVWKELVEKQNVAVAIFLGAIMLGIATIIASAIHG